MTGKGPTFLRPRWLVIALVVSVGLNLFLLGLIGGAAVRGKDPRSPRDFVEMLNGDLSVPPMVRKAVRQADPDTRTALRADLDAMRTARQEARSALTTEPFDRAAAEAALDRVADASRGLQMRLHALLLETAARQHRADGAD